MSVALRSVSRLLPLPGMLHWASVPVVGMRAVPCMLSVLVLTRWV